MGIATADDSAAAQGWSEADPGSPIEGTRNPTLLNLLNLLDLYDDDRWRLEHAFHSAGHALALVLVGHQLTDDDLQSTLTLDPESSDRPYVAAMGVLTLAAAWTVHIARDDNTTDLDLDAVGDQLAWVLSNSGSCCYHADSESDLDDTFDEEGVELLDDTDWVDDHIRLLLIKHWPAVEALTARWYAGEPLDARQTEAVLRADYPTQWAEAPAREQNSAQLTTDFPERAHVARAMCGRSDCAGPAGARESADNGPSATTTSPPSQAGAVRSAGLSPSDADKHLTSD